MSHRILIVEGSPPQAQIFKRLLEGAGYAVQICPAGEDALAWLAAGGECDLVLSDSVLPGMDGFEMCRRLKSTDGAAAVPFLLMTSSDRVDDVLQGLAAGADCFMIKSVGEEQIVDRVAHFLGSDDPPRPTDLDERLQEVIASCTTEEGTKRLTTYLAMALQDLAAAHDRQREQQAGRLGAQRAQEFLQSAVDALSSHIAILDQSGDIIAVNAAWNHFAEANDWIGNRGARGQNYLQQFERGAADQDALAVVAAIGLVVRGEQNDSYNEYPCHTPGEKRWFSVRVTRFEHGGETRVVVAHDDISERVRSEQELQEQQELLRETMAQQELVYAHVPIYSYCSRIELVAGSLSFPNQWVSENVESVTGINPSDYASSDVWFQTILDEDKPGLGQVFGAIAAGEQDTWDLRYRMRRPDNNEVIWLHNSGKVLRDASGKATQSLGIAMDITRQKNSERELRQSQRLEGLGSLAGGIAHDFNNLLTTIVSYATFIKGELDPESPQAMDTQQILAAAARATSLTSRLLAFSRQQPMETRVFDVGARIAEMQSLLGRTLGDHIELTTNLPKDAACALGDPGQFDQVVLNLAINARDAMANGGKLTMHCTREVLKQNEALALPAGEFVRLTVADTGTGMDDATALRVFEPFYTTKPESQGTGLGLSTCYGIIKQMHGTITLKSELGVGTCFEVLLPATDRVAEEAVVSQQSAPPFVKRTETLLIVEDEDSIRAIMERCLTDVGFSVLAAADGPEGVRLFEEHRAAIDLVVSDVLLPGLTGYQLAAHIRQQEGHLPILLTSGFTGAATLDHHRLSNLPLLRKPFSGDVLAQRVVELLAELPRDTAPPSKEEPQILVRASAETTSRILLIDDDAAVRQALKRVLSRQNLEVVEAASIAEARQSLATASEFSAIVCDLNLGDGTGEMLLDWVVAECPKMADRILFLTGGATDEAMSQFVRKHRERVLRKPVAPTVLIDQVRALVNSLA